MQRPTREAIGSTYLSCIMRLCPSLGTYFVCQNDCKCQLASTEIPQSTVHYRVTLSYDNFYMMHFTGLESLDQTVCSGLGKVVLVLQSFLVLQVD